MQTFDLSSSKDEIELLCYLAYMETKRETYHHALSYLKTARTLGACDAYIEKLSAYVYLSLDQVDLANRHYEKYKEIAGDEFDEIFSTIIEARILYMEGSKDKANAKLVKFAQEVEFNDD
jgi:Flp pilus assembly protein TadD